MAIIGYNFYGDGTLFEHYHNSLPWITKISLSNGIYDEMHVTSNNNISEYNKDKIPEGTIISPINTPPADIRNPAKEKWRRDTVLSPKFNGDLSGGNIENKGVPIVSFIVKRKELDSNKQYTIGKINYDGNKEFEVIDYTQPAGNLIYSITPIGEDGIEGVPNEIPVRSEFAGWWVIDKDNKDKFMVFDKVLNGRDQNVDTDLNQGRIVLQTLSRYPQVYYTEEEYHTFSLSSVIIPNEYSFEDYKQIVNMLDEHKPYIVKSGSGDIYVCDIFAPKKTSLLNAYYNNDYITLNVSCMEICDYDDFLKG